MFFFLDCGAKRGKNYLKYGDYGPKRNIMLGRGNEDKHAGQPDSPSS